MATVIVKGGKQWQRDIVNKSVDWCLGRLSLKSMHRLHVTIVIGYLDDCCGWCKAVEETNRIFRIAINNDQSLREFVMTIVHEMIHVKQYARNEWLLDGEPEAWGSQEILTDELWLSDIL